MYQWIEQGVPMPKAARIKRDPNASDGIARDTNGNALGGLRTPWVEVPDATYLAKISQKDPLRAGMRPFSEEKMEEPLWEPQTLPAAGKQEGRSIGAGPMGAA